MKYCNENYMLKDIFLKVTTLTLLFKAKAGFGLSIRPIWLMVRFPSLYKTRITYEIW